MLKLNYRFKHPEVTTVVLTAHPLQRAGAFALAVLAEIRHPLLITEADLLRAVESMHAELRLTAHPADSKDSLDAEELAGQLVTLADLVGEPDTSMQAAYRGKATLGSYLTCNQGKSAFASAIASTRFRSLLS